MDAFNKLNSLIKSYKISTITKNGTILYNIADIAKNICDIKSDEKFRRKIYDRIKINQYWYTTMKSAIDLIKQCGKLCAKQFIRDNQTIINKYLESIENNKLKNKSDNESDDEPDNESDNESNNESDNELDNELDDELDDESDNEHEYDIIDLKKSEKLRDTDGNIIEIEVRGERQYNKCFFKVYDVMNGFKMPNLHKTIIRRNNGYKENIHYKYLCVSNKKEEKGGQKVGKKFSSKKKFSKKLFLTYTGLLRVLFVSQNKTVGKFIDWATQTLFAAHLGTHEQKEVLASKILGINANVAKEVFNKTSSTLPAIYWFNIGKVKDLRKEFNIGDEYDDDDIVAKLGETDNLNRRIKEHISTYSKIPSTLLHLKWYNYIDPQYTTKAETDLFHILDKLGYKFDHPKHQELIIYPNIKKEIKVIEEQFTSVSQKYIGHIKDIADKLKDRENELKNRENELKITKLGHDKDLLKKDLLIQQKNSENKILRKDLKLANKKIKKLKRNLKAANKKN